MIERKIMVKNRAGVHAWIAERIVQTANRFDSRITFERNDFTVDAKSIIGIITMALRYNSNFTLKTEGPDEQMASDAISDLFESKFE